MSPIVNIRFTMYNIVIENIEREICLNQSQKETLPAEHYRT